MAHLLDKIVLCFRSIKDIVFHLVKTGKMIDRTKLSAERLQVCEQCQYYSRTCEQCKICGCFIRIKTRFIASRCPMDRW